MEKYRIEYYRISNGTVPVRKWLTSLKDLKTRAILETRINRLVFGGFGQHRSLGASLFELKIDYGPGYRIYCSKVGETIILLLCGGDKKTQQKDIEKAKLYLQDFRKWRREYD